MAIEAKKFRRRQYLVEKKFQLKYVGQILLLMFLTAALCSYVVYYTSMLLMGERLASVYPQGRLIYIVKLVNFRILLSIILVSPLVAVIGIFLSHRIAGPIFRMEKFIDGIAAGDLSSRIVLRKKDELKPLADKINGLADSLKYTISDQKVRVNKMVAEIETLKKELSIKSKDGLDVVVRIEDEVKSFYNYLNKFKL